MEKVINLFLEKKPRQAIDRLIEYNAPFANILSDFYEKINTEFTKEKINVSEYEKGISIIHKLALEISSNPAAIPSTVLLSSFKIGNFIGGEIIIFESSVFLISNFIGTKLEFEKHVLDCISNVTEKNHKISYLKGNNY